MDVCRCFSCNSKFGSPYGCTVVDVWPPGLPGLGARAAADMRNSGLPQHLAGLARSASKLAFIGAATAYLALLAGLVADLPI